MSLSSDVCKACISATAVVLHVLVKKALQLVLFTSMPASHRLLETGAESLAARFQHTKNTFGQCARDQQSLKS